MAKAHPDSGYPFLSAAGEIETLIKQGDFDAAERLTNEASGVAQHRDKLIKLTQLELFETDIAIGRGQLEKAIQILLKTIPLAQRNQTGMLSDVQMKLAQIYRQQHKLALAEHYSAAAFAHTSLTKDLFTAPARLEFTAELQWDLSQPNGSTTKHHARSRNFRGPVGADEQRGGAGRFVERNEFRVRNGFQLRGAKR